MESKRRNIGPWPNGASWGSHPIRLSNAGGLVPVSKPEADEIRVPKEVDKTMVQFLAYSLDSLDPEIVELSLQVIDLTDLNSQLKNTAKGLYVCMTCQGPAYSTRSKTKSLIVPDSSGDRKKKLPSKIYKFLVFGLNYDTRDELERLLIRVKGVISVVVDVEHQKCIVRTVDKVTPEILAEKIGRNTSMEAHLIVLNMNSQEVLKSVFSEEGKQNASSPVELPPYLTEEDSPVKDSAILSLDRVPQEIMGKT
ncbi:hypothetical protein AAG570_004483 [Ranatra chinensis]|uniref:Uncharacterized protein n=1 Tax=Ranatra chinensis TaxID=642074 RepID=A0ABD0Y125_9HEMI